MSQVMRGGTRCRGSTRLEVVDESSPVKNVQRDEGEREQKSGDGVDLTDTVHLTGSACQLFHALVATSTHGRSRMQTLVQSRPDAAAALSASPQLRRTRRRRRADIVLTAALGGQRRLRLPVDVLRRRQCALDRFASGATIARRCGALFDFLHAFLYVVLSL